MKLESNHHKSRQSHEKMWSPSDSTKIFIYLLALTSLEILLGFEGHGIVLPWLIHFLRDWRVGFGVKASVCFLGQLNSCVKNYLLYDLLRVLQFLNVLANHKNIYNFSEKICFAKHEMKVNCKRDFNCTL